MSTETWYRGEGIGVAPAKAGGHDHDFGEGMYLTDRKDVAEVYAARRATTPDGRRVYVVTVERASLGRVLDLSLDARWSHFMNDTSDKYHMGKSRLDYVKIKHEIYGKYFNDFLALHKIDIKSYDAVIGPEYNLGGNQICILHKNGLKTKLHERVRALFRLVTLSGPKAQAPVGQKPGPVQLPKGQLPKGQLPKLRVRAGLRTVARTGVAMGTTILLAWVWTKVREWLGIDEMLLDMNLKRLEPEIETELAKHTQKAIALLSVGRPAYGNVQLKVFTVDQAHPEGTNIPIRVVMAYLTSVSVSHMKVEGAGNPQRETKEERNHLQTAFSYPLFVSLPLSFPQEQVDLFRSAIDELYWYEEVLANPFLHKSDVDRLLTEKREREQWMEETFGLFPIPPVGPKQRRYAIGNWFDDD